jgi:hypothetical protein
MNLYASIQQIMEKHKRFQHDLTTKASINVALVQPFLNALGYDVTNPSEVHCGPLEVTLTVPETSPMAIMLGGLVLDTSSVLNAVSPQSQMHTYHIDYLILHQDQPLFIMGTYVDDDFETCYNTMHAVFAFKNPQLIIMTNGCVYQFFADFSEEGILDAKPFAIINLNALQPSDLTLLEQLHKHSFHPEKILKKLAEIEYMQRLEELISDEFSEPSLNFINYWLKRCGGPEVNAHHQEMFSHLIKMLCCKAIDSTAHQHKD